jgi:hypothetical protein
MSAASGLQFKNDSIGAKLLRASSVTRPVAEYDNLVSAHPTMADPALETHATTRNDSKGDARDPAMSMR